MPEYKYSGPVDSSVSINKTNLKDKTAIVTGGASGIGEGFVRALAAAGVYVCIGDINEDRGLELEKELHRYPTSQSSAYIV
jgi:NAD(P)-dependent dehydrogenase (short-subunit alcohol dehydrogenase family)